MPADADVSDARIATLIDAQKKIAADMPIVWLDHFKWFLPMKAGLHRIFNPSALLLGFVPALISNLRARNRQPGVTRVAYLRLGFLHPGRLVNDASSNPDPAAHPCADDVHHHLDCVLHGAVCARRSGAHHGGRAASHRSESAKHSQAIPARQAADHAVRVVGQGSCARKSGSVLSATPGCARPDRRTFADYDQIGADEFRDLPDNLYSAGNPGRNASKFLDRSWCRPSFR